MKREAPLARIVALALALVGAVVLGRVGRAAGGSDGGVMTIPDAGVGTGTASGNNGLVITPTPLDFGSVSVMTTHSSSLSLVNTNTVLAVRISLPLGKPNTTDCNAFTVNPTPNLPDTILAGGMRTWPVTFTPATASSYDCQWTLSTDDGKQDVIHLTGVGVVGHITVTPNPVPFGSQPVGGNASQPVTVSNDGSGSIQVTAIMLTDSGNSAYSISNLPTLPVTLKPSGSTQFTASFSPTKGGPVTGTVQVSDSGPASTGTTVTLTGSGSGTNAGAGIVLTPSPVDFGDVPVGGGSDATLSIGETGTVSSFMVTGMSIAGSAAADFHFDDAAHGCTSGQTCSATFTVTAGSPVSVPIDCSPSASGSRIATLTVTSTATSGVPTVTLQCTGTAPQIDVSPGSISFGVVRVNTTAQATLTIGNTGTRDLHVSAITFDGTDPGDFGVMSCATGCTVTAGTQTMVTATFTPPVRGVRTANLHVMSDDPTTPDTVVPLDGTGGLPVMVVTQPSNQPPSINFGQIPINTTSSTAPITIQNQGELTLNVSSAMSSSTTFSATGPTTPLQIAPTGSATWNVTCGPTLPTTYTATFTIAGDDPSNSTANVGLSCTGINSNLSATPSPVAFGEVRTDRTQKTTVTITNNGALGITIDSAPVTGTGFTDAVQGTLPRTLNMGDQLLVDVTFAPPADMHYDGTLTLMDNTGASALQISLSGDGRTPGYSVAPTMIGFGSLCVSQASSQNVVITNTGDAHISLVSTTIAGSSAFTIANGNVQSPVDLAPTANYTVQVVGTAASGTQTGDLIVTTDVDADKTTTIPLSITGTESGVVANPSSVMFGPENLGVASSPSMVSIINCSAKALDISAVGVSGADASAFQATGPQPVSIPIGADQAWSVVFTPSHAGGNSAQLELTNDGPTTPLVVALSGTGQTSSSGDGGVDGGTTTQKSTSYYACSCRAGASPGGAAPLVLAFAALVWPRRRRRK